MTKTYTCSVCGYTFSTDIGDEDNGIEKGVTLEELPDDWTCPVCGVPKDMFEEV